MSLKDVTVLVLGGDGFCGWPTALRFSVLGASVVVVDNGSRRRIGREIRAESLTDIASLQDRVGAWAEVSSQEISQLDFDVALEYDALCQLLTDIKPDIIVHFAEQRSAPYSMQSSKGARYSVSNNIATTHNVLAALVETGIDAHLIHLGTIGVYGYSTAHMQLPEGYLRVTGHGADGRDVTKEILYPGTPDSVYHMTKMLDQHVFAFYARQFGLRITDLHQGVVWGNQSAETRRDARLVNRLDHDAYYGTVVNRFLVQACSGKPLTIYGSGTQRRAFIHIEDMLTCLELAAKHPPAKGDRPVILNQIAETASVNELAQMISALTGASLTTLKNPRDEPEGNEFEVSNAGLQSFGFVPRKFHALLPTEVSEMRSALSARNCTDHTNIVPIDPAGRALP